MSALVIAEHSDRFGHREHIGRSVRSRHLPAAEGVRMAIGRDDAARRLDAERRLAEGKFLGVSAIALLAGAGRSTTHGWIRDAETKYGITMRYTESLGGQRRYHPDDVRTLIAKTTKVHGGPVVEPEPDPSP